MTDDMPSLYAAKAALRKGMLRTLRQVPEEALASQSAAVANILREQPFYENARTVGCYLSMAKGELRTDDLVSDILAQALYTPYLPASALTGEDNLMHMLRLYSTSDLKSCPTDKWGILDPGTCRRDPGHEGELRGDVMDPDSAHLDLILIPGVAFDSQCHRMGRGKGFYDRFLATYANKKQKPLLVALALEAQLVDDVPVTSEDFTLDAVVSPHGLVWRDGAKQ